MHRRIVGADRFENDGDIAFGMEDSNDGIARGLDGVAEKTFPHLRDGNDFAFLAGGRENAGRRIEGDTGQTEIVRIIAGLAGVFLDIGKGYAGDEHLFGFVPNQGVILDRGVGESGRCIRAGDGNRRAVVSLGRGRNGQKKCDRKKK